MDIEDRQECRDARQGIAAQPQLGRRDGDVDEGDLTVGGDHHTGARRRDAAGVAEEGGTRGSESPRGPCDPRAASGHEGHGGPTGHQGQARRMQGRDGLLSEIAQVAQTRRLRMVGGNSGVWPRSVSL